MQLDGVTPSAFEKSDALRAAFRRGLAMMLHIKEEDVLFLDITPNTDEDGQAMKDGVHVSFSVLRTSKEEANAAVVVLRSLTEENNQAGVPNARLRNHLKDAGLHANSATVIEPPTITEPSEDLRGTSYDNLVTNRTIYAPPPMRVPKVPKKEEGSYFVLRSAMSIVGYSAAEFGKKESSQFLRGIRTFFVIGKADATVLLVKDAPESTSKNPVVNVQFQLVEHDRMKATLTLQVFILMKDRTTAQLANLAHVFKFKGLKKVTSCFIHGEPSVEMRKHQPPPPPAPPMPPSPPPKMLNIERNVTKNVEIISSKLKFKTTSSVESFDETRKDAVRAVLASFISSRVGSTVPSDSIRIISIKMNGVVKYFDLGMSTNTMHHYRTGKIMERRAKGSFEPILKAKIAVPNHAFKKRIDHANNQAGSQKLRAETGALGNAARNNRRNSGGECQQEEKLHQCQTLRVKTFARAAQHFRRSQKTQPIGNAIADKEISDGGHAEI